MTDAATSLGRAEVMLGAGRFGEALGLLAPVVAAEPDNSRAFGLLTQALLGAGKVDEARTAADRAVHLDPASAWPHRLRSVAQRRAGNNVAAVRSAQEACRLEPQLWLNHFTLAQAALGSTGFVGPDGRGGYVGPDGVAGLQLARQASQTARELAPDEPSVHFVAGQVSRAEGDTAAAVEHYQRVLALDPGHSSAINELGRIQLERGKAGAAARHFVQAAQIAPGQSAFGHNVEIAVARAERSVRILINWVIYGSWLVVLVALGVSRRTAADRIAMLAVLAVAAAVVAVAWQVQLRRMPRQARPLFQGRSMLLALGVSLGSMLIGVTAVEFLPIRFGSYLLLVVIFMLAARFAAFKILRDGARKRYQQIVARSGGPARA